MKAFQSGFNFNISTVNLLLRNRGLLKFQFFQAYRLVLLEDKSYFGLIQDSCHVDDS